jgi:hypothetical protein
MEKQELEEYPTQASLQRAQRKGDNLQEWQMFALINISRLYT